NGGDCAAFPAVSTVSPGCAAGVRGADHPRIRAYSCPFPRAFQAAAALRVIQHPFLPMVAQIVVSARPFTSLQRSSPRPAGASSHPTKIPAPFSLFVWGPGALPAPPRRAQASDAVSPPPSQFFFPLSPHWGELPMRPPLLRILLVASSASVHFKPDPIGDL